MTFKMKVEAIPGIQEAFDLPLPEGRSLCPACKGTRIYRSRYNGQEPISKEDYSPCCSCRGLGHVSAPGLVQTCPARMQGLGPWDREEGLDRWYFRGQDLVCSFCGSIHPARFRELVALVCQEDSQVTISQGKPGKMYVNRPDVPNASVGGIKFYVYHYEFEERKSLKAEDEALLHKALKISDAKQEKSFSELKLG